MRHGQGCPCSVIFTLRIERYNPMTGNGRNGTDMNQTLEQLERSEQSIDEKEVLLILADISGYTRYMVANRHSRVHGQIIISELMQEILSQVEPPLEVAKLEGDAVFLYAARNGGTAWEAQTQALTQKIPALIQAFQRKISELTRSNICNCGSCRNIENLKLKVIVHHGRALIHQIGRFLELSGVDVILVHRLLKNSIARAPYILLTDSAKQALAFDGEVCFETTRERYDEFGAVPVHVHYPGPRDTCRDACYCSLSCRTKNELIKIYGEIKSLLPFLRKPRFNNVPAKDEAVLNP